MIRKAFVMQVNADAHEEYQRRHNPHLAGAGSCIKISWRTSLRDLS